MKIDRKVNILFSSRQAVSRIVQTKWGLVRADCFKDSKINRQNYTPDMFKYSDSNN